MWLPNFLRDKISKHEQPSWKTCKQGIQIGRIWKELWLNMRSRKELQTGSGWKDWTRHRRKPPTNLLAFQHQLVYVFDYQCELTSLCGCDIFNIIRFSEQTVFNLNLTRNIGLNQKHDDITLKTNFNNCVRNLNQLPKDMNWVSHKNLRNFNKWQSVSYCGVEPAT